MTRQEIQKILRRKIIPHLNGWEVCGSYIYLPEPFNILRGICIEGSGFSSTAVYVWAFVMPLYVPVDTINFDIGMRLKDRNSWERWNMDPGYPELFEQDLFEAIKRDGIPLLERFASPMSVISELSKSDSFFDRQAVAYSLAYMIRVDDAIKALTEVAVEAEGGMGVSPWLKPICERARHLIQLLRDEPETVQPTFARWMDENRKVLKLPVRGVTPE
jgi:hypothetical protein